MVHGFPKMPSVPEFTSEGIEYALKNGEVQIAEDAEITLIDRYQELTIQYPEVCTAAVKLSSRQILSAGKKRLGSSGSR